MFTGTFHKIQRRYTSFTSRPITNDTELIATQNQINHILDKGKLTQDDRDYLKVLGTLVYDYEDKNESMPTLKGIELLTALLEESNLQPKDLAPICQSESIVLDILNRNRELTASQMKELATFFHISPAALFE
ncbi:MULTISPECIES: helix-turn-helix domain-containing protein [unclassified Coleofasciculus]|uniref:helix-turn-helix domain-containing protein n=1 Tax=unclassified Coleofasciculus TaxID=2692782 RepID=UPI0018818145|nr:MULTISPECIES: transcriptional regulator [unclassified Coleofasciculus]MBE9128613.1 transcriptional regulator [Coleofasciculus sp. LEGE 07081]MBE9151443.1 transcriptional regulator [Coleofasciculus sp. LEGE 07092]